MIYAKLISGGAELQAFFFHESSNKQVAIENVKGHEDAQGRVDFYNRNYMATTLINWLKQRNYAMQLGRGNNSETSAYLLNEMVFRKSTTYRALGKFINRNISLFNKCVPGEKSEHFKHYLNEVKPILDFCSGAIKKD